MSVNKERVRKFVAALRSGKFQQGAEYLGLHNPSTDKDTYCCLGVACEVAIAEGLKLAKVERGNAYEYDGERYGLPGAVMEWYGFITPNPAFSDRTDFGAYSANATAANDIKHFDFYKIADLFEQTYLNDAETELK